MSASSPDLPTLQNKARQALDFAAHQIRSLVTRYPDYFPMYTQAGKWKHTGESWTNWCEGFLGGQLWILSTHLPDPWFRQQAEHYSRLIEHRKTDRNVHDLGFLFLSTWKRWYDLTGDPAIEQVVLDAGKTLALRFNSEGKYLRSFLAADSLFIDIMMNVGIIFYAAERLKDPLLYQVATQHSLTTRRYLVRGDGSTSHEGIFDLKTGEFLRQTTQQGYRNDSSWARGQAWALYGFGTVYSFTRDPRFLATAENCAQFYMQRTPAHGVPPNDWEDPAPRHPYESSAAAIAASGLLKLSHLATDPARCLAYKNYALRILETLLSPEFLADQTPGWEGILKHGCYHYEKSLGVDESVMWGEYFFLEALDQLLKE